MGLPLDAIRQHHLHPPHRSSRRAQERESPFASSPTPTDHPQMNYASAFLALIFGASAFFWYIGGRRYYTGPLIEAHAEGSESDERTSDTLGRQSEKDTTTMA